MNMITQWAEQGYLPDRIIRFMIRMLLQARLKKEGSLAFSERLNALYTFRDQLHKEPIAHAVDSANQQHYEVPADLFETFMGPHLKYSSGFWADDATTLAESEKQRRATNFRTRLRLGLSLHLDGTNLSKFHHYRRL
jgi:cyclopropane-fatty-acyl-phospholipid synthase